MPTRKVGAGLLAGSLTVILIWAMKQYGGTDIPGEVGSAITTILTFFTSWFVPDA